MTICFLREGSDYLADANEYQTLEAAKRSFRVGAEELAKYGQTLEASIHIARSIDEVHEYPDYVLSLGPRGGLVCERA